MTMDSVRFALPLLVVGGLLFWNARQRFHSLRRIEDTARSKAVSAPQGHIELQGIAWPEGEDTFVSSTGSETVYHLLKLQREETRGTGKSRRREWVTVFRKEHRPQFFLADATGLVRVDPVGVELDLVSVRTRTWRSLTPAERERVVHAIKGESITGFPPSDFLFGLFASSYRILESEIRVGSPLYAHGDFRTMEGTQERGGARGLTLFHRRVFDAARREQKKVPEMPGRGDEAGFSAKDAIDQLCGTAAADREAARTIDAVERQFPIHGRLATSREHKLFVADRQEEHLVKGKTWNIYLPFLGGVAAVSAAIVLLTGSFDGVPPKLGGDRTAMQGSKQSAPASIGRDALKSRCMRGEAAACDQLLRRSGELHLSDDAHRGYAEKACELGMERHCAR